MNNNHAETKRIPLEHATKEELIAGILSIMTFTPREQAEKAIFWARQQSLLDEMKQLCDVMDENRQVKEHVCLEKHERWMAAHKRWKKINNQLSKLQGV